MNNRLKIRIRRLDPAAITFIAIPVSLYLPVLYYSLTTPFALVDDYGTWRLDMFHQFYQWVTGEFLGYNWHGYGYDWYDWYGAWRYRPFWEFYTGLTWNVFGATPWLHHLARWATHFGAVGAFAAAFLCFERRNADSDGVASRRVIRLMPLTALVYLWIFFPNQPAARLAPQEVHTVFFIGICAWMAALTLLRQGKPQSRRAALLIYAAFCIGFCGVAWSKENNIAAALWLLISYYALPVIEALRRQAGSRISAVRALNGISVWKALGGLPLIAVFLHTLSKVLSVYQSGGYDTGPATSELLIDNAAWLATELFQVHTSLIITIGLALLSLALLAFVVINIAKRRFSDDLIFTLFLLGLFACSYLILCASPYQVFRYWYVLIPVFTTLLAFAVKFILEFASRFNFALIFIRPPNLAAYALTAFIAFFVCCNYHDFLYQTVVQRIARHSDENVLAEITRLLERDKSVYILYENPNEHLHLAVLYYREFLPQFYGREYKVHTEPPQETDQPYYTVRHFTTVRRLPEVEESYYPLTYAYRVADRLQMGRPHNSQDAGASIPLWHIYDYRGDWIWWNGETLDIRRLVADAGEPIIRSDFDVYLNGRWLIYINERCSAANLDNAFFLGVFPVNNDDLPESRRSYEFHNLDFIFANYGFGGGERCIAVHKLPQYPISWIHTGQYVATEDGWHNTWEGGATLSDE